MSKGMKTIFGGTDRSGQRGTKDQNRAAIDAINEQGQFAQNMLAGARPEMQRYAQEGFQGAANMLGAAMPQQLSAMNQGNMAAQQYLLGGLPAFQNHLLGGGGSQFMPQMQPMSIQTDPSAFQNVQMPGPPQMQPQQGAPQQPDIDPAMLQRLMRAGML